MRLHLALATLLVGTACLRSPSGVSGAPDPVARSEAQVRNEAARARLRLDSAARAGDLPALADHFATDALLITEVGDTVRGPAAIAQRLGGLLPQDGGELALFPRRTESCIEGAYEYGGDYAIRTVGTAPRDLATGAYALRWARGTDGELRVHLLILHHRSEVAASAARSEVRCTASRVAAFGQRRFEISITPPHAGVWTWSAPDDLTDHLSANGWRTYILRVPGGPVQAQPGPKLRDDFAVGAIAALWRVRPPISVRAVASFMPARAHVFAYSADRSADLFLRYEGYFTGALVSYEWRRLRGGVGPALILSDWRFQEERVYQLEDTEGNPVGWQSDGVADAEHWRTVDPALLAELAYTQPITARVFADFAAHGRLFATSETHDLLNLEPVSVDLGGFTFAISLGVAF